MQSFTFLLWCLFLSLPIVKNHGKRLISSASDRDGVFTKSSQRNALRKVRGCDIRKT